MSVAVITGASGLIGSESAIFFAGQGFDIVGIDNDMRRQFFGPDASTTWNRVRISELLGHQYTHYNADIRDTESIFKIFQRYGKSIAVVIHTAAQPSHDWAAKDPFTDFAVNADGTMVMLEASRQFAPEAVFIFTSTNKVYGDTPNMLPLIEQELRWDISPEHTYVQGIREDMSIDMSLHSLFGASKVAADILVQEYGRYFGMKTVCFRGGCLTGPSHSGTKLHGFLAYLMKCTATGQAYTVFGYKGKQVRDNIHSQDLVRAFFAFYQRPGIARVYNIGGGRDSNCSMLEGIALCESITGRRLKWTYSDQNRIGDHIWWISDISAFRQDYPEWSLQYSVSEILTQIYEEGVERWRKEATA